jgi:glycosyltransferase involved in cell wall biosynthesis
LPVENKKPTVALVMIVKNEEEILEKSLKSVKDIVDEFIIVDTGSTDKTKSIIKKYGKLYEVPFEDFVTTKNKALEIAKDKSEYILFMDADEVLYKGKDILRKIAEEGKVECVSCKITEGPAEDYNNISNQYERARMWRNDGKWTFHGKKVHEYIYGGESINFVDEILVRHEHLKSTKEEDNKKRYIQYIKWLEENVEEDPKDSRSWFYLARSYVDTKQLEEAIICYNKYLKIIENDFVDERWQSSYDIANCYMNLGEFDKALEWCKTANLIDNRRAEHFVLAGFIYYTLKDFKKAIEQYEQAIKPIPNVLLFQKPLEYNVIPNDYLSVCYFSLGDFKKALYYSNENKKLNKEVSANDYWYERRNHIPIWLIAGNTPEPIYGGILNERGVHGVETAYIELAKHLAKLGHKIYLFCNTEKEHIYDNVLYTPYYNIGLYTALQEHHPDILITSREINTLYFNIPAIKILWQQDAFLPHLSSFPEYEKRIDAVVCSSKWHKNYIYQSNFLKFEKDTVNIIPLGIDKSLYAIPTEKERYKVMYNSSPDRGLDTLVNMWDEITRRIPQINLYVTYGWDSMKKWSKEIEEKAKLHENKTFKNIDEYKNIHFTGRLTKKELMQHQMSSELLLYPNTHFYETYCLSVLEAQAAGMVVVTSDVGALSTTTLRENNFLLIGTGGNKFYDNEYINTVEYILNNPEELKRKSENNRNIIMNGEYDWSDVAKQWESLFFNLLKGR